MRRPGASEQGQVEYKPKKQAGEGENFGDAVDLQHRKDKHGGEESPLGGFSPKGLLPVGGITFGGQTGAKRGEQARHRGKGLLGMCCTLEVLLRAANQAEVEKGLARNEDEKSRQRRERAQPYSKEQIAKAAGKAKMAVGSITGDWRGRADPLRRGISAGPGADCSGSSNEQGCNSEERTLQKMSMRRVLYECPNDVIGDKQIAEKGERNKEEVQKRLMTEFEVGGHERVPLIGPQVFYV